MSAKPFLAGFLVLTMLLAGCSSAGSDLEAGDGMDSEFQFEGDNPDAGSLEGAILDDEALGIRGATVGLVEVDALVRTDEAGTFRFVNVDPGKHTLSVIALGYDSESRSVEVIARQATTVTITLQAILVQEPFYEVNGPMTGYFECGVGTATIITGCGPDELYPNDKRTLVFQMAADYWETFVGELQWDQSSAATAPGLAAYISYVGRQDSHWWCASDGPSPNQFYYENPESSRESECSDQGSQTPEPSTDIDLSITADPGFASFNPTEGPPVRVIFQQRFDSIVTIFYGDPAPMPYTAFPDQ